MTQAYMQSGRTFKPVDTEAINIQTALPPGTYTVAVTPVGYHLEKVEDFTLPVKLYGNTNVQADRIASTFLDRPAGTGVLLSGPKGAGKTMLTKRISQKLMAEQGVITILVNQPLCGEGFNSFIQDIAQPAVILFDEFEKVYDRDDQARLLTLFDGTYPSKKLFLLTCNNRFKVDSYMLNRPGRLYYALDFKSLDREFIADYCADNLKNMANVTGVMTASGFFTEFSFDMLKALVEEMNRYNETATESMKVLNMKPESDEGGVFDVTAWRNGKQITGSGYHYEVCDGSPLSKKEWTLYVHAADTDEGQVAKPGDVKRTEQFHLDITKLLAVQDHGDTLVFESTTPGVTMRFKRKPLYSANHNYDAF